MRQPFNTSVRAAKGTLRVIFRVGLSSAIGFVWAPFYIRLAAPYVFPKGTPLTENTAMKISEWGLMVSILLIFAALWRVETWLWPKPVVSQEDRVEADMARARRIGLWLRSRLRNSDRQ